MAERELVPGDGDAPAWSPGAACFVRSGDYVPDQVPRVAWWSDAPSRLAALRSGPAPRADPPLALTVRSGR